MRTTLVTALKGAAMGIAEVIPGVSGGTIAFITGIYQRLLHAIGSIGPSLWPVYRESGLKGVLKHIDATFLAKLFAGMVIGFVFGLFVITHLLEHHPILIWSFFFGLILASIPLVARQIEGWSWKEMVLLALGALGVYWITVALPAEGSEDLWFVCISGMLAVSALMLPGLSGSFVLLLLGMYGIVMPAIKEFLSHPFGPETALLLAFGVGLVIGVFSFARVLNWTFRTYRNGTLALLTGLLIGSLNKVWPWQHVISTREASNGELKVAFSKSVLPGDMARLEENFLYGTDPHTWTALGCMLIAVLLIYLLDRFAKSS